MDLEIFLGKISLLKREMKIRLNKVNQSLTIECHLIQKITAVSNIPATHANDHPSTRIIQLDLWTILHHRQS